MKLQDYVFLQTEIDSLLQQCKDGLESAKTSLSEDELDNYLYRLERLTSIREELANPLSKKKESTAFLNGSH
jgi:septation ring formation regulator EzrA